MLKTLHYRNSLIQQLGEYADLDDTELGAYCRLLIDISYYRPYFISETFETALVEELETQLTNFKEHSQIKTLVRTVQETKQYLEWNN